MAVVAAVVVPQRLRAACGQRGERGLLLQIGVAEHLRHRVRGFERGGVDAHLGGERVVLRLVRAQLILGVLGERGGLVRLSGGLERGDDLRNRTLAHRAHLAGGVVEVGGLVIEVVVVEGVGGVVRHVEVFVRCELHVLGESRIRLGDAVHVVVRVPHVRRVHHTPGHRAFAHVAAVPRAGGPVAVGAVVPVVDVPRALVALVSGAGDARVGFAFVLQIAEQEVLDVVVERLDLRLIGGFRVLLGQELCRGQSQIVGAAGHPALVPFALALHGGAVARHELGGRHVPLQERAVIALGRVFGLLVVHEEVGVRVDELLDRLDRIVLHHGFALAVLAEVHGQVVFAEAREFDLVQVVSVLRTGFDDFRVLAGLRALAASAGNGGDAVLGAHGERRLGVGGDRVAGVGHRIHHAGVIEHVMQVVVAVGPAERESVGDGVARAERELRGVEVAVDLALARVLDVVGMDREFGQALPARIGFREGAFARLRLVLEFERRAFLRHHHEVRAGSGGALPVDVGAVLGHVGVAGDVLLVDVVLAGGVPPRVEQHRQGQVVHGEFGAGGVVDGDVPVEHVAAVTGERVAFREVEVLDRAGAVFGFAGIVRDGDACAVLVLDDGAAFVGQSGDLRLAVRPRADVSGPTRVVHVESASGGFGGGVDDVVGALRRVGGVREVVDAAGLTAYAHLETVGPQHGQSAAWVRGHVAFRGDGEFAHADGGVRLAVACGGEDGAQVFRLDRRGEGHVVRLVLVARVCGVVGERDVRPMFAVV